MTTADVIDRSEELEADELAFDELVALVEQGYLIDENDD